MPPNFTSQRHHQQHFPQQQMQYRDVTPVFCSAPSEQNHQYSQFLLRLANPFLNSTPDIPLMKAHRTICSRKFRLIMATVKHPAHHRLQLNISALRDPYSAHPLHWALLPIL
jgi:hypothetical protein